MTHIKYPNVHRHLQSFVDAGQISCLNIKNKGGKLLFNEYEFIKDDDNIIELYGDMPTEMEIPETPFLRKMLGYNEIEPAKNGRTFTEADISRIKREKQYTKWTPKTQKKTKHFVSGSTLLWF